MPSSAAPCFAQRSLHAHVERVALALEDEGIESARARVSKIVGRDTASLDEAGVARAAIESLAENFSDGVVAPALWMVVGGLPGAAIYKAINTADSMIGHHSERYEQFGWASARLDDLVNLPASRLSALLIMAAAYLTPGASAANAFGAVLRDADRHRSPNAGYPEAAMAGALGLALAGPRYYGGKLVEDVWMGDGRYAVRCRRHSRRAHALPARRHGPDRNGGAARDSHRGRYLASASSLSISIWAERCAASSVEGLLDEAVIGDRSLARAEAPEPGRALAVVGEETVDIGADDAAIWRHGAIGEAACELGEGPRAIGTLGHAHMHLVAGEGRSIEGFALDLLEPLLSGKRRLDIEKAEALRPGPAHPRCHRDRGSSRPSI